MLPYALPEQMGHATAEAVVRAGLTLVPYSLTGESEAVAVGNVGVSGEARSQCCLSIHCGMLEAVAVRMKR